MGKKVRYLTYMNEWMTKQRNRKMKMCLMLLQIVNDRKQGRAMINYNLQSLGMLKNAINDLIHIHHRTKLNVVKKQFSEISRHSHLVFGVARSSNIYCFCFGLRPLRLSFIIIKNLLPFVDCVIPMPKYRCWQENVQVCDF